MEAIVVLCLIIIVLCLIVPLVAIVKASRAQRAVDELRAKLRDIEAQIRSDRPTVTSAVAEPFKTPAPTSAGPVPPAAPMLAARPASIPPPLPVMAQPAQSTKIPPPPGAVPSRTASAVPAQPPRPPFNWEQFMGAKLFAWIGGLALFLGVGFFVKYSFEHNLIPPEVRVAIGFVIGLALIVGGLALKRKENVVTSQTLCATGVVILYAVTFACRNFYHFQFFGTVPTFILMSLITVTAFLLAVRMDALVVAILGIAGGFLTPVLLSEHKDNPLALFGYIALLDIGLLLVARRKNWISLPIIGAVGTILMQATWAGNFFESDHYYAGNRISIPMGIFLGFEVLYLAILAAGKRDSKLDRAMCGSTIAIAGAALLWGFFLPRFSADL